MVDEAPTTPEDDKSLRQLLRERSAERDLAYEALKIKTLEVEKLKLQVALLRRQLLLHQRVRTHSVVVCVGRRFDAQAPRCSRCGWCCLGMGCY